MKKWNPYIPPPNKEEGKWKHAIKLGLVIAVLIILLTINQCGVEFRIGFQFQSYPEAETSDDSRQTALEIRTFEDFTA